MFCQSDKAFDSEGIKLLSMAFHKAWIFVENDRSLEPLDLDERRSALAWLLMELARGGETDAIRLANAAIFHLRDSMAPVERAPVPRRPSPVPRARPSLALAGIARR